MIICLRLPESLRRGGAVGGNGRVRGRKKILVVMLGRWVYCEGVSLVSLVVLEAIGERPSKPLQK